MSKTYIPVDLRQLVAARAHDQCEYCPLKQEVFLISHHVDHIIAEQHGGKTIAENLAYSCAECNFLKGPNLSSIDWETGEVVLLFNPRTNRWNEHFVLEGAYIQPLTPTGRATVNLLRLNDHDRLNIRQALLLVGLYP